MVNSDGQLYTIEGVSAGVIMLLTAYIVLGSTSIYTPGDTHISDMQLEQLGNDALRMMNTPLNGTIAKSPLQSMIETDDGAGFNTTFLNYCNNETWSRSEDLQFSASVTYRDIYNNTIDSYPLYASRSLTGGEHAVKVTEWVIVNKKLGGSNVQKNRAALVEVMLWRG
ncbi:MAG: hypothetical protein WC391_03995 [Methanoregula sp.]|jgi:hypothetical protein